MNRIWIAFIVVLFIALEGCKKEPESFKITSSVSKGGTINPLGVASVESGSSMIFTIKPDANYTISSIKVDGVDIAVSTTVEIKDIKGNKEIKVEFTLDTFTLTASADAGVVIDPRGTFLLNYGDSMTFSFDIKPGRFVKSIKVNNNLVNPYPNKSYVVKENSIILRARENTSLRIESILKDSVFITSGSWYINSIFQKNSSLDYKDWTPMTSEPRGYTDHKIFDLNGYFTVLDKNEDLCGGPYEWSINKKTLVLSYNDYTLIKVSKDTLIYDQIIGLITYREIHTHKMKVFQ